MLNDSAEKVRNMKDIVATIVSKIEEQIREKERLFIAIDGRCGAGKTTLALQLQEKYNGNIIHMDDFFLRPEQRRKERLMVPGENVDHERFWEEVLLPLQQGKTFSYRPFDCQKQKLMEPIVIEPRTITIIEGSYCCHEKLWPYFDLRIFLTVEPAEQLRRIKQREGTEKVEMFLKKWIPMEEKYFLTYGIQEKCDYVLKMNAEEVSTDENESFSS